MEKDENQNSVNKSLAHMSNQRTFLAWIRTCIALMGFGFVVMKFNLFLKEISFLMKVEGYQAKGITSFAGAIMIALGVVIAVLAFLQYKKFENQLNHDVYYSTSKLLVFLTVMMAFSGIGLMIYLISLI